MAPRHESCLLHSVYALFAWMLSSPPSLRRQFFYPFPWLYTRLPSWHGWSVGGLRWRRLRIVFFGFAVHLVCERLGDGRSRFEQLDGLHRIYTGYDGFGVYERHNRHNR